MNIVTKWVTEQTADQSLDQTRSLIYQRWKINVMHDFYCTLEMFFSNYQYWSIKYLRPPKKICVFTVTQPTLFFHPDHKTLLENFWKFIISWKFCLFLEPKGIISSITVGFLCLKLSINKKYHEYQNSLNFKIKKKIIQYISFNPILLNPIIWSIQYQIQTALGLIWGHSGWYAMQYGF
jgi:hypothetical protein